MLSLKIHLKKILRFSAVGLMLLGCSLVRAQEQQLPVVRRALAPIEDPQLTELSGIVASRSHKGCFWVHNDSGDGARLYLIDQQGTLKRSFLLEGVTATDVEDIAWFEQDGKAYLALADIGDNLRRRSRLQVYIFEEPLGQGAADEQRIARQDIRVISLRYPDKAHDAEALMVDPVDHKFYVITKRDFRSVVYSFEASAADSSILLHKELILPFNFVTAAEISPQGDRILMKNLLSVYGWRRPAGLSLVEALARPFIAIDYSAEPQGEGICFDAVNTDFYTISERPLGLDAYLYQYSTF